MFIKYVATLKKYPLDRLPALYQCEECKQTLGMYRRRDIRAGKHHLTCEICKPKRNKRIALELQRKRGGVKAPIGNIVSTSATFFELLIQVGEKRGMKCPVIEISQMIGANRSYLGNLKKRLTKDGCANIGEIYHNKLIEWLGEDINLGEKRKKKSAVDRANERDRKQKQRRIRQICEAMERCGLVRIRPRGVLRSTRRTIAERGLSEKHKTPSG